jgi:hypothetical protein
MIGCKKFDKVLSEPYNLCKSCASKHRHNAYFGDTYPNHNGENVPNCLWVDHKYKPKEVKLGG